MWSANFFSKVAEFTLNFLTVCASFLREVLASRLSKHLPSLKTSPASLGGSSSHSTNPLPRPIFPHCSLCWVPL